MPRQARLDVPGLVHHVMARGIEGRDIFRDDEDRERFLARLAEGVERPGGPRLYAWALMSNHFHLLLRAGEGLLSPMMRRLMTGHAVFYNLRHRRQGHLFQNRYKSVVVEEEPYFLELVRYIHLNPVRAGMVKTRDDLTSHRYSGHSVIMGKKDYPAQDVVSVLERFSTRREAARKGYSEFVAGGFLQGTREELRGGGLIRSAGGLGNLVTRTPEEREAWDGRILGSGDFVEKVLRRHEAPDVARKATVEEVLGKVSEETGIGCDVILGPSRNRIVSAGRRLFFLRAHEETGATVASLARLTGRSHVAVRQAIEPAREEKGAFCRQ
jgi:putative transposase